MQDGQWRARAAAAETACARGIDAFTKLLTMIESGQELTDLTPLMDDASAALAAMRAAAAAKGEARAKDSRRMRRSDALVLAQLAAGLLASGHRGSASTIARIAHRMAKLTGAATALAIADAIPQSSEEPTLPPRGDG
jgi:hypothetical protein